MYTFGSSASPYDIRTFTYTPTTANKKGGERFLPEDIDDQHKVGICTAISTTMRAQKFFKQKFSPEFQYLCQKKFYDLNWTEGSSISHALKVGKNIGFLPLSEFPMTEQDRYLPYHEYVLKLQAISDTEIERMKVIASQYKIKAYASVPVNKNLLKDAIDSTGALLTRFVVGEEWWTPPIEPLTAPQKPISGHATNTTNHNGDSFRQGNSWGKGWGDNGTAYFIFEQYAPTEAWSVWFEDVPKQVQKQIDNRGTVIAQIMDLLQQVIVLLAKLK